MTIRDYLNHHILIMDGAMGTYYESLSGKPGEPAEEASLARPELIRSIHTDYLESGARLLRTNTFMANRALALSKGIADPEEQEEHVRLLIREGYHIAEEAAGGFRRSHPEISDPIWIAADIGPIPDSLFFQSSLDKKEEYRFLIDTFLECGARIFDFETFSRPDIPIWASGYIRERCPDAFVMSSYAVNRYGYTGSGISLRKILEEISEAETIDCCGCNCMISAGHMYNLIREQTLSPEKFIMLLPNSGYRQAEPGRTVYADSVSWFAEKMEQAADLGVNVLGGCCGTQPAHIQALSSRIGAKAPSPKRHIRTAETARAADPAENNPFLQKLQEGKTVIAVELDPPFDQNADKLLGGAIQLSEHHADIITLSDSPLARVRADSVLLASKVTAMTDMPVMPHMACRDRNRISMHSTLLGAHINGIRNFLFVTGDPVPSASRANTKPVFDFNSIKLMEYASDLNSSVFSQDPIAYGGALNQNQANLDKVIERMQRKIDAGASWFLTQPIYSDEDIERIRAMKSRLSTKILCGIMPLVSYKNAKFIQNEMPGIHVPDEIVERYSPDMSRAEAEAAAREISWSIIERLRGVADGYYFMTPFNRVSLICDIIDGIPASER